MNKSHLFLWLCLGVSFFATARGEDIMRFPQGDAAWTVDTVYPAASAATPAASASPAKLEPSDKPKRIEVVQKNNVQKVRITWTNGVVSEQYTVPGLAIFLKEDPRNNEVGAFRTGTPSEKVMQAKLAFSATAFEWIKPGDLTSKDPIPYRGKKCLRYDQEMPVPGPKSSQRNVIKRSAWIDSETLLPVALLTEESLSVFTFRPPPGEPLVLPPKFQQELNDYKQMMGFR